METVAASGYARGAATRSPACCAAMSFSQSYRPKVCVNFANVGAPNFIFLVDA